MSNLTNSGTLLHPFNDLQALALRNKFDRDYRDLPVGKARKRKIEYLRRLQKAGVNKQQLIRHGHRMNMYGSDISEAINSDA